MMASPNIKLEILLPLNYNDKTRVEEHKFVATYDELIEKFNGVTVDRTPLLGGWVDPATERRYQDETIVYWIVCKSTTQNLSFIKSLKPKLEKRFRQNEILMYYILVYTI
jgi:hypothetical protein